MTRDEIIAALSALDHHLDHRIRIVHVIIDGGHDGVPVHEVGRVHTGSFIAPPDWQPRTLDPTKRRDS